MEVEISWMELGGGGWSWVELGVRFSSTRCTSPLFGYFAFSEITESHSIALQQRVIGEHLFKLDLPGIPKNLTGIDILVCIAFDAVISHMI